MFTGLIRHQGRLRAIRRQTGLCELDISALTLIPSLKLGDSVAVNGVCQTVTILSAQGFRVQARGDTLSKTTLGQLKPGALLNLEPAMILSDRVDGHLLQGHVNAIGRCLGWDTRSIQAGRCLYLDVPQYLGSSLVAEGSIAIDGISLTVAGFAQTWPGAKGLMVRVSVIPHTLGNCTLGQLEPGDQVNIETDFLLRPRIAELDGAAAGTMPAGKPGLSLQQLAAWGYA